MTVRGPIASLPLVAEPEVSSVAQFLTQTARYDNPDTFGAHNVFRGAVTITETARFNDADTFPTAVLAGGARALSQAARFNNVSTFGAHIVSRGSLIQIARFNDPDTFFQGLIVGPKALTQTARYDNPDTFFFASAMLETESEHPDIQVGFPPDGSGKKKRKQTVRIKWRDTAAEAEARLLEEQRLAEMAQLKAFEAYLIKRRKIAAATALLLS